VCCSTRVERTNDLDQTSMTSDQRSRARLQWGTRARERCRTRIRSHAHGCTATASGSAYATTGETARHTTFACGAT